MIACVYPMEFVFNPNKKNMKCNADREGRAKQCNIISSQYTKKWKHQDNAPSNTFFYNHRNCKSDNFGASVKGYVFCLFLFHFLNGSRIKSKEHLINMMSIFQISIGDVWSHLLLYLPFSFLFQPFTIHHPFPSWENDPKGCLTNMFYFWVYIVLLIK